MIGSNRKLTAAAAVLALSLSAGAAWGETLNAYTIWSERYAKAIFDGFTAHTGIKVRWMRFSSGELQARLEAEKANPQADVVFGDMAEAFVSAMPKGIYEPYIPKDAGLIPAEFKDPEGCWTGVALDPLCFMTNRKFLKENNLKAPASWEDLLDKAYEKKLQMADARTSGTAMYRILSLIQTMGEDKAYAYQKALDRSVQTYTKSGAGGALPVARGQAAGGIFFLVDGLETLQKGFDVVISYPGEGVTAGIEAMALVRGARHPELARKFLDWASGQAMQRLYGENSINLIPTNPQVPPASFMPDIRSINILPLDIRWAGRERERLVKRWVEEVIP